MKLFTYIDYFSRLRALIGFRAACAFSLAHVLNTFSPPRGRTLASVPVGPYVFYFPSLDSFVGLFTEIFFNESYYLAPTNEKVRVVDCGANIGMSLLYIKLRAPRAHVLCFEPNPAARTVLEKNVAANGWNEDVRVFPYALGSKKGAASFFVDDQEATSSGGSLADYPDMKGRSSNSYEVTVDVLSQYIDGNIDLLKMDIEGGEFDVLEDLVAKDKLRYISAIQLEYHYAPGFFTRSLSTILFLLESGGFRTFAHPTTLPHKVVGRDTAHAYMVFAWR